MTNASTEPKRRAVASNVTLSIDAFVQLQVDLLSARPTDRSDFRVICPDCEVAHPVSERYICSEDPSHGPFTRSQLRHAREIDKALYATSEDDYAAVKATTITDSKAAATVRVFKTSDVTSLVRPTGSSYLLRPQGNTQAAYAALAQVVGDAKLTFLCELLIRGSQKLYRIEAWNDQLVLQELVRPNELAPAEAITATVDKAAMTLMKKVIEGKVEKTFDAKEFRYLAPERVAELDARLVSAGNGATVKGRSKKSDGGELLAALQASIAAGNVSPKKKATKRPAKVTPIKKAS